MIDLLAVTKSSDIHYAMFIHVNKERALALRYAIQGDNFVVLATDGTVTEGVGPLDKLTEILDHNFKKLWSKHCVGFSYVGDLTIDMSCYQVAAAYAEIKDRQSGEFDQMKESMYGKCADAQRVWLERRAAHTEPGTAWMSYRVQLREDVVEQALDVATRAADMKYEDLDPDIIEFTSWLGKMLADMVLGCLAKGDYELKGGS